MSPGPRGLAAALDVLEKLHGKPARPLPKHPLDWILWENVAYLVGDEARAHAYRALEKEVGLAAEDLAKASAKSLLEVARIGGMHPERRVDKLREIAELAIEAGGGRLEKVLDLEAKAARKVLKRFPGIGDPGADKILLFCGASTEMSLESNGLRVAVRLGYGEEAKSYATTYGSAITALEPELERKSARRVRAYELLRTHGQVLCKRSAPDCDACPITKSCRYFARVG
jgi:endonuclease III